MREKVFMKTFSRILFLNKIFFILFFIFLRCIALQE